MNRLVDFYPRAWRARYGDELADLVAARPIGLRGAIDLVRGALDAYRHPELVDPTAPAPTGAEPVSRQRYEDLRVARRLGIASRLGAIPWIFAWVVAANGPMVGTGDDAYRDGSAAMPLYFGITSLAIFASMGLPGLSGFISEILVFLGAFRSSMGEYSRPYFSFQSMTVVAALGVILTAAYLLWMLQRVFLHQMALNGIKVVRAIC